MWSCCYQNAKGSLIEQLLNHSLILLNNKQHTYNTYILPHAVDMQFVLAVDIIGKFKAQTLASYDL